MLEMDIPRKLLMAILGFRIFLEIEMLSLNFKSSLNIKEKLLVLKDRFFLYAKGMSNRDVNKPVFPIV